MNNGIIIKIQGPVVDVRFKDEVPQINEALLVPLGKNGLSLTLEVAFELGNKEVRALALGTTDGLSRGMEAIRTNKPIQVPVGEKTLGRIFNVLGETIDDQKPLDRKGLDLQPIKKNPPLLSEQQKKPQKLETVIKVLN